MEVQATGNRLFIGVVRPDLHPNGDYANRDCPDAWYMHAGDGSLWGNGKYADDAAGECQLGDRVGVLLDMDLGSLQYYKNGVKHGYGFPPGSVRGPVLHALQIGDINESARLLPDSPWPARAVEEQQVPAKHASGRSMGYASKSTGGAGREWRPARQRSTRPHPADRLI